jgi:hypothetical protein
MSSGGPEYIGAGWEFQVLKINAFFFAENFWSEMGSPIEIPGIPFKYYYNISLRLARSQFARSKYCIFG